MSQHDYIGAVGVVLIVGSYAALQAGRLRAESIVYSVLNAVGAALVLTSLFFEFNTAAAAVEGFWLLISLVGIGRALKSRGAR